MFTSNVACIPLLSTESSAEPTAHTDCSLSGHWPLRDMYTYEDLAKDLNISPNGQNCVGAQLSTCQPLQS